MSKSIKRSGRSYISPIMKMSKKLDKKANKLLVKPLARRLEREFAWISLFVRPSKALSSLIPAKLTIPAATVAVAILLIPIAGVLATDGYSTPSFNVEIVGFTVTLTDGTASAHPLTGNNNDGPGGQHVGVDWDFDKAPEADACDDVSELDSPDDVQFIFTGSGSDKNFTATWATSTTYASAGTYTVRAVVYHANCQGVEGSDFATFELEATVPPDHDLDVSVTGNGAVTDGVDINCTTGNGGVCTETYPNSAPITLTATPDPGWVFDSWGGDCSGTSPTCDLVMDLDKTVTATFTTDLTSGTLTLLKDVIKDNGGTALDIAWTLSADGPTDISGQEGDPEITDAEVTAGTYTLSEDGGPDGYEEGEWVCVGGAQDEEDPSSVTIEAGEDITCTITNNDVAPSLTLIKEVDGGDVDPSEWTLSADGADESPTDISGQTPVVSGSDFKADTYILSESEGPDDYVPQGWVCTGDGVQDGANITLDLGESATCTITNIFVPPVPGSITIFKNTVGGDATFGFTGDLGSFDLTTFGGTESETFANLPPGTYTVSETEQADWEQTDAFCDDDSDPSGIDLEEGETVTCTFENTKQVGTLIIVKNLTNDDEGTTPVTGFSFQVNEEEPILFEEDGQNEMTVPLGPYTITEVETSGYTTTYENCDVEIGLGETETCTIFNNDNEPEEQSVPTPEPEPESSGGGGGGGGSSGSCGAGLVFNPITLNCDPSGEVLGASIGPTGEVLGESCGITLGQHLKMDSPKNDPAQVTKLQQFLNKYGYGSFTPTGHFGSLTYAAVQAFQSKYAPEILTPWSISAPTGIVYLTTTRQLNLIECSDLTLAMPELVPWNLNPFAQ